jgi:hypothetical protein
MRKLLSILPDGIHPWMLYVLIYNELLAPVQDRLLDWCVRSGPEAIVIEELRSSNREMFRRIGLTLYYDDEHRLRKVSENANIILSR